MSLPEPWPNGFGDPAEIDLALVWKPPPGLLAGLPNLCVVLFGSAEGSWRPLSEQLVVTARRLAGAGRKKPRQSDLKRAVSTAHYALSHAMARNAADMLIGVRPDHPNKAWTQVYRALEHGPAKNACKELRNLGFPAALGSCGVG